MRLPRSSLLSFACGSLLLAPAVEACHRSPSPIVQSEAPPEDPPKDAAAAASTRPVATCGAPPPLIGDAAAPARALRRRAHPLRKPVLAVAVAAAPHARRWATLARGGELTVWNDVTAEASPGAGAASATPPILGFTADGDGLVVGSARIDWRADRIVTPDVFERVVGPIQKSSRGRVTPQRAAFSPSRRRVLVEIEDEFRSRCLRDCGPEDYLHVTLHLVDTESTAPPRAFDEASDGAPFAVGDRYVVTTKAGTRGAPPTIHLWHRDEELPLARETIAMGRAALPTIGVTEHFLATVHRGTELVLWDLATGCPVARWATPSRASIEAVAFAPDDAFLVTASRAGLVEVWSLARPGERIATGAIPGRRPDGAGVTRAITVTADGKRIILLPNLEDGVVVFDLER